MSSQPPAPINPTLPGTILAGKYRVERIIGQGGMGVVVEARHIALEERVALKFLLPEYATHPEASGRFLREARAAVKIKGEHVARVSDVGTLESGAPYMVMEFLEGEDLSHYLVGNGVLPMTDAVDYVVQGCEAIAEAHVHGIVHRDIKPANLFLTKKPNGMPLVKVLDFGISKMSGSVDNLTRTTASMGSALYMSPEQMQATRGVDHRTDIYALGVSLYELLAGKQPYYADTLPQLCAEVFTGVPTPIRTLRPDLPEGLAVVLEKAYARDRANRYQTVAELVVALAPFASPAAQSTIESVAKMAGVAVPIAGAPSAAAPDGGARLSTPSAAPVLGAAPVVLGAGPLTGNVPATTGPGLAVTSPPRPSSSKSPMIAVALVAVLALGGTGAYFATRGSAPKASAAPSTPDPVAADAPKPPAEAPKPTAPPEAPKPAAVAEAPKAPEAAASPSAPPTTPTATAVVAAKSAPASPGASKPVPAKASGKPTKTTDVAGF